MARNKAPNEYRLDDQIGFRLRLAHQRHLETFARMMPDVTPTQFAVLAKLLEVAPISQNRLGRAVGMDAATTKGVVDRLHNKGFVSRTPSQKDLRRLEISLTQTGREFTQKAAVTAQEISTATAANLTKPELDRLLALLDKVLPVSA